MSLIDDDALGEADVGERGVAMTSPTAHTPGSPVRQRSSTSMKPALVDLHPGAVEAEVVGVGPAADRHDDQVDLERVSPSPKCTVVPRRPARRVAVDLHAGADVDAPLLERPHDELR